MICEVNLKAQKNHLAWCAHVDGGIHTIEFHFLNVTKANYHRLFIVGAYDIWCSSYEFLEVTCFKLVNLIK